uniref:Uncharacterized protein n=1 Tax=Rhizophora mucronata TaxID=61149 RepID=A0A2P2QY69_RHIMU
MLILPYLRSLIQRFCTLYFILYRRLKVSLSVMVMSLHNLKVTSVSHENNLSVKIGVRVAYI